MISSMFVNADTVPGVVNNLTAAVIIAGCIFLFRNTLAKWARRWFPALESKTPHINFQTEYLRINNNWTTQVRISNAASEPAYNVYVFMAEKSPMDGNFRIRSLGASGVRRPVLGIHDNLTFDGVDMSFLGCNATTEQQLWIEFENSAGVTFRMVALPATARGDEERVQRPRIIKHRLEQIPNLVEEGSHREWRKYQKGSRTVMGRHGWPELLRQTRWRIRMLLRPTMMPASSEGRFRAWIADRFERKN